MRWIRYAVGILGAALMAAAGISPQDAASNLAAWADSFGLKEIPSWLSNPSADTFAFVIGAGLIVISVAFGVRRWRQKRHRQPSPTAPPSVTTPQDSANGFIESVSIRGHLNRGAETPSSDWRKVKELTIWQIAHLWVNQEPHRKVLPGDKAFPILRMLKDDVTNYKLLSAEDSKPGIHAHFSGQRKEGVTGETLVKRRTLIDYIRRNKHQPLWNFEGDL